MNREIKFKAWDKVTKLLVDLIGFKDLGQKIELWYWNKDNEKAYCVADKEYIELMQYTGLKDKNDKEIYEGDIVKVQYAFTVSDKSYNFKVCYDEDNAGFLLKEITKSYGTIEWFDNLSEHEFEVIGNIYENSALLKE